MRIFVTGDRHGNIEDLEYFCQDNNTSTEDILIILGDAGFNYYLGKKDNVLKGIASKLPITLFCVHGNHEARPQGLLKWSEGTEIKKMYRPLGWNDGVVYIEEEFPNIIFPADGEIFNISDKKFFVCGGAYSVDKYYRLSNNHAWWPDEQPDMDTKFYCEINLKNKGPVDYILTHTCPLRFEPTEVFLPNINQSSVDKSTEAWLDTIYEKNTFDHWYCGHYHTNKSVSDKVTFLFKDIKTIIG